MTTSQEPYISNHDYLSIQEQQDVINKLGSIIRRSSWKEKFFLERGDLIAGGTILAASLIFWRAGFRAFDLFRYGKGRLVTGSAIITSSVCGFIVHATFVRPNLVEYHRKEDKITYGLRALACHQYALFTSFTMNTFGCFYAAMKNGIIPIPEPMFANGNRQFAMNYYAKKLKPFRGKIIYTWICSSIFMFTVGMLEYKESQLMLSKMNRKTIHLRE